MSSIEPDVTDSSPEVTGTPEPSAPVSGSEETQTSVSSDASSDLSSVESVLATLTGEAKPSKTDTNSKPEGKPEDAASAPPKKTDAPVPKLDKNEKDPFEGLDRDRLKTSTQKRINDLYGKAKDAERALEETKALVAPAQEFVKAIQHHKLAPELKDVDYGQVAGAIQFQAALNRLAQNRPRQGDKELLGQFFDTLDSSRQQAGLAKAAPTAAVDTTKVEETIRAAINGYHLDSDTGEELLSLIKGLGKAPAAPAPTTAQAKAETPAAPQTAPERQEPQDTPADDATLYYEGELIDALTRDGVKDLQAHVAKTLLPAALARVSQRYPGQNPAQQFDRLPAHVRYDLLVSAHRQHLDQRRSVRPASPKPETHRPLSTTNGLVGGSHAKPVAGSVESIINTLTGE